MLWDNVSPSFVTYSRPISLWRSQAYLGRLTLSHPNQNLMVFSTKDKRSGVLLLSAGERAQRDPILIGFNLKSPSIMSRFSDDAPGYLFSFLSMQEGGVLLKSTDHQSLMHLNASGKLSFFADDFTMDVNIPKKSRIDDLVIDPIHNRMVVQNCLTISNCAILFCRSSSTIGYSSGQYVNN